MKYGFLCRVALALLAATLLRTMGAVAFAEETLISSHSTFSMTGKVVAGECISLTAQYGGRLLDYTVRTGDIIQSGQTVFSIETTKVYAPCDGIIGGVRVQPGDEASFMLQQYGALMYLEPDSLLKIDTNTSAANDDNKWIHVGETVYLRSVSANGRTGAGYVTRVDGKSFSVEITDGNLRVAEQTSVYRTNSYAYDSRIGTGKTVRINPVAITGEGSVLTVLVTEGQEVKRGDVLAELVEGVLTGYTVNDEENEIYSAAILCDIAVRPGQQVSAGQVLATLHPLDRLQVEADLNELDLERIQVGDAVQVELLGLKASAPLDGAVIAISALSHTETSDAEYKLYVTFPVNDAIREGMSVTVSLKE